ncbi:MAG: 2-(1,2-epoxy-1,2-dihydrophenyl)acetyl-CoA isomerase [Sphingomonadales bacterium]|nr:MAG: 2-(1,2-epoxy-1,2-dihydrophenyl)acetyl-CoA isomerase [Sphingomonadales bacterium]
MDYRTISLAEEDGVATVTLEAPERLNAIDPRMAVELAHVFGAASAWRAILLTGAGRAFSSGADLSPDAAKSAGDEIQDPSAWLDTVYNPMVVAIRDCACPVVTAVNGPAVGIGCALALMGDIVVAKQSAYFLQAFRRVGLIPDGGSTFLLPRLVGKARAMELMLLGDRLDAQTALDWGLINRAVPDDALMPTAREIARSLAKGPASLGLIRSAIWASLDVDWARQLANERQAARLAVHTSDYKEGVQAFLEKRPPEFTGH